MNPAIAKLAVTVITNPKIQESAMTMIKKVSESGVLENVTKKFTKNDVSGTGYNKEDVESVLLPSVEGDLPESVVMEGGFYLSPKGASVIKGYDINGDPTSNTLAILNLFKGAGMAQPAIKVNELPEKEFLYFQNLKHNEGYLEDGLSVLRDTGDNQYLTLTDDTLIPNVYISHKLGDDVPKSCKVASNVYITPEHRHCIPGAFNKPEDCTETVHNVNCLLKMLLKNSESKEVFIKSTDLPQELSSLLTDLESIKKGIKNIKAKLKVSENNGVYLFSLN